MSLNGDGGALEESNGDCPSAVYMGVGWHKGQKAWQVCTRQPLSKFGGGMVYLGAFKNKRRDAEAHDVQAKKFEMPLISPDADENDDDNEDDDVLPRVKSSGLIIKDSRMSYALTVTGMPAVKTAKYAGHSMQAGGATSAAVHGLSPVEISHLAGVKDVNWLT